VLSKRRGLGKGLEALIPVIDESSESKNILQENYKEINIDDIKPANGQSRQLFEQDKLTELAASIKEHGVIQPVVVRPSVYGGYELIAGERRWRACQMIGLKTIPAVIKRYMDIDAAAVSLIENVQRVDLNPIEEATAYRQLIEEFGLTQEEVSERVGKSRPFVANMIRLLSLPDEIIEMVKSGQLNAGHARAILSIQDTKKQLKAAEKIINQQLNVRQAEKLARDINEKDNNRRSEKVEKEQFIKEIEEVLNKYLGTRVKLKKIRGGGGKLEINYRNGEELKRIIDIVLGEQRQDVSRETLML